MHKKFQTEIHKNKLFYQKMKMLRINTDMDYYVFFKLSSEKAIQVVIDLKINKEQNKY
jgi:hypothetical protein